MDLNTVDTYLDTYGGRDKFLKAICYGMKFATCSTKESNQIKKLQIISSELSNCRLILRSLDYVSVIKALRTNGLGLTEPDWFLWLINAATAILDPIFYPLEQIAWAAEKNLLKIYGDPWSNASTVCWVLSLYLDILRCMRNYHLLHKRRSFLRVLGDNSRIAIEQISRQQRNCLFLTLKSACDLTYAIHYLPGGFLWSGKLKTWQVGLLGVASAIISISQALSKLSKRSV